MLFNDGRKEWPYFLFALLIVPVLGWFVGWILKLSFGGAGGGWSFFLSLFIGFILSAFITPIPAVLTALGFFFGIRRLG